MGKRTGQYMACEKTKRETIRKLSDAIVPQIADALGHAKRVDRKRTERFAERFLWPYAKAVMLVGMGAVPVPGSDLVKAARKYRNVCSRRCLEERIPEEDAYRQLSAKAGDESMLAARLVVDGVTLPAVCPSSVPPVDDAVELISNAFVRIAVNPNKGHTVDGIWDGVPILATFAEDSKRDSYEQICEGIVRDVETRFSGQKASRNGSLASELRRLENAYQAMPDSIREDIEASTLRVDRQILPYDIHERKHDLSYLHNRMSSYASSCLRNLYGEHLLERRRRESEEESEPKCDEAYYEILKGIRKKALPYLADRLSVPMSELSESAVRDYVEKEYSSHARAFSEYAYGLLILPPPRRLTQSMRATDIDMKTRLVLSLEQEGVSLAKGRKIDSPIDSTIRGGIRGIWGMLRRQLGICSDGYLRHMFLSSETGSAWKESFDWNQETEHRVTQVTELLASRVLRHIVPSLPLPWKWFERGHLLGRVKNIVENAYAPDMGFVLAYATGALQAYVEETVQRGNKELAPEKKSKAMKKKLKSLAPRGRYYADPDIIVGISADGTTYPWSPEHALSDLCSQLRKRMIADPPISPIDEIGTSRRTLSLSLLPEDRLFVDMTMELVSGTLQRQRRKKRQGYSSLSKAYSKAYDRMMARHFGKFDIANLSDAYAAGKWYLDNAYGYAMRDYEPPSTTALYSKRYITVRYDGATPVAEFKKCVRSREKFRR